MTALSKKNTMILEIDGSYKRVMRAIDASLDAGLNLILSTVLVKGRGKTKEFEELM